MPLLTRRAFTSSLIALPALSADTRKPNIVVILADDLGYGDLRCYNAEARTASLNLDRLASRGMRFTDAHSPSAVCTPTRYGVVTGRYCWRSRLERGVLNGYSPSLIERGRATIASVAQGQGYRTGCFGKWHLGLGSAEKADYNAELRPSPNDSGFDEFFGIPASLDMPPYLFIENRNAVEKPTSTIETNGAPPRGPFWRGGPIAPSFKMEDVLPKVTERACRFVAESAKSKHPFLAYVPLAAPHTPWVPTDAFKNRSRAGLYGDFVEQLDASAGQILTQLEQSGVANNTLVIFTSDNGAPWVQRDVDASGGHRANGRLRGQKSDAYEGGHRVPFIARWPRRIRPGTVSGETICHTDIMATVAAATGARLERNAGEDSYNLLPVLTGQLRGKALREATVHHTGTGVFSIRQGDWKLIAGLGSGGFTQPQTLPVQPGGPAGQLFNLRADPREESDVYTQYPDVVSRLSALLERYRTQGFSRPLDTGASRTGARFQV